MDMICVNSRSVAAANAEGVHNDLRCSIISNGKIAVVLVLFAIFFCLIRYFEDIGEVPIQKHLSDFPESLGDWEIAEKRVLPQAVEKMLGVDDYIDYVYSDRHGNRVALYVSYFAALGEGRQYHSPQNCLPGRGWNVLSVEKIPFDYRSDRTAKINKMIVGKNGARQMVFYWYQNRGRIVASEYRDKIYSVLDSITLRRRDGAFIRVMSKCNDGRLLESFSCRVAEELRNHLPGKQLPGS